MKRPLLRLLLIALTAFLPVPGMGQTASLVRDLAPDPGLLARASSDPRQFMTVGNKVFFTGLNPSYGNDRELWVTDGTPEGTQLLGDFCPGECGSEPVFHGSARGLLFFTVKIHEGGARHELWRSDGTRKGTFRLASRPRQSYAFNGGSLFFSNCDEQLECNLWRSDGTVEGTVLVKDLSPGYGGSGLDSSFAVLGSKVYFIADALESSVPALWVSDGTEGGTSVVRQLEDHFAVSHLTAAGNRLFFTFKHPDRSELWTSDGTTAGTRKVEAFEAPNPLWPTTWLKPAGNEVFFLANDVIHETEIWRSDGTPQGTRRVTDIGYHDPFDYPYFAPDQIARIGDRLLFIASDGIHRGQVWTALGTPESTAPLEGCAGGCPTASESRLFELGGRVLFAGEDAAQGREPWSTDGTPGGTRLLKDICPGSCGSGTNGLIALLGAAFFFADEEEYSDDKISLWRSDGTPGGTKRFAGPSPAVTFEPPAVLGKRLLFSAHSEDYGVEPWIGDGTPGGTRMLADLVHGAPSSLPQDLTPFGSQILLTASVENCRNVWRSSGAPGDLPPVTTVSGSECSPEPRSLAVSGGLAYFWLDLSASHGYQVWASDGTPGGNRQVTQVSRQNDPPPPLVPFQGKVYSLIEEPYPDYNRRNLWRIDGNGSSRVFESPELTFLEQLSAVGDRLYFTSYEPNVGIRLWVSDGAGSTNILVTLQSNPSAPQIRVGGWDYFGVYDSSPLNESSLWKTNGTPSGTMRVKGGFGEWGGARPASFIAHQGVLYFFAAVKEEFGVGDWGLWRSDGTESGTRLIKVFQPHNNDPVPALVSHGGHLFFVARDEAHGRELWRSDGTAEGTVLVRDIVPGEQDSGVDWLTVAGGRLFFSAFDPVHGTELWTTDGTEAGTRLVHDIAPMAVSSRPDWLTAAGDRLFFVADDGVSGRELWSMPLNVGPQGCQPSATTLCLNQGRFRVGVTWQDFQGNTGQGQAKSLTADTGTFWFFNPENVELVVKVLDGQGLNGHHWVFYGALSSVEYNLTVTDTQTGLTRHYFNPLNRLASVGDTRGFGSLGAFSQKKGTPSIQVETAPAAACQATATRLCLQGGRFAAEMTWKDFAGKTGKGQAVSLTGDTGYFWFFNAANVEVVVKVLDGRPVNDHFWAFYGALSNVEYTLKITDTQTGAVKTYSNPSGNFASVADTNAF